MKKKVIWLSRHELTDEQKGLLLMAEPEAEIVERAVHWSATKDEAADNAANASTWRSLAGEADAVVGIFPPVAIVGLVTARGIAAGDDAEAEAEAEEGWGRIFRLKVLTPVSVVGTLIVPGTGEKRKAFQFLRWQEL